MNALRMMQDHLHQTTVIFLRRCQKTFRAIRTRGNVAYDAMEAATQARERQEETRRLYEQKCQEAGEAETIHSSAIKDTLDKAEALEKRVETVTTRWWFDVRPKEVGK